MAPPPKEKEDVIPIDMQMLQPQKEPQEIEESPDFHAYDEQVDEQKGTAPQEVEDEKPAALEPVPEQKSVTEKKTQEPQEQPEQSQQKPQQGKQQKKQQEVKQDHTKKPKQEQIVDKDSISDQTVPVDRAKEQSMPSLQEIGDALEASSSKQKLHEDDSDTKLQQLYGSEYEALGEEQKRYLTTNLQTVQSITQSHLNKMGYPAVAVRTRQNGVNIVEFFFHPNGDISDLRLIKESGYRSLDRHSKRLIELAYKDYPYPKEKTLIRIRVMYNAF